MGKIHGVLNSALFSLSLAGLMLTGCRMPGVPFVRYVPTPDDVVLEMLELARVNPDDVVYDLGCGDGRFVITAAKKFGARGVGVDIDPHRIRESRENARQAGVADRVNFFVQDLFQNDIREATVVTLYLFPDLNRRLLPKLYSELKPGTRILSYQYGIGEWRPDHRVTVAKARISPEESPPVYYYWVVPARAAGVWRWTLRTSRGEREYVLSLAQTFQEIRGSVKGEGTELPIKNPRLTGDRLAFTLVEENRGQRALFRFQGRISGDSLVGSMTVEGGPDAGNHPWMARRTP